MVGMTAWRDVEEAVPEFAGRVRALFDAHRHKTIATLRADGSPRISGIEAAFEDGELTFGSMPQARKSADLRRDPRFALHSATVDPVEGAEAQWPGEAKVAGRAVAGEEQFRADIAEVVHTHLNPEATPAGRRVVDARGRPAPGRDRVSPGQGSTVSADMPATASRSTPAPPVPQP